MPLHGFWRRWVKQFFQCLSDCLKKCQFTTYGVLSYHHCCKLLTDRHEGWNSDLDNWTHTNNATVMHQWFDISEASKANLQCWAVENHQDTIYAENGTFQDFLKDVKSGTMLFFKFNANRYGLRLSNESRFIIIAQWAAKLWPVKVRGWRKKNSQVESDSFLLSKSGDSLDSSSTFNFNRLQLCSPLSYDDEK